MEQTNQTTVQTPTEQPSMPTSALFNTLMVLIETHISDLVIAQVNRILTNHTTLRVIDEGFKQHIRDIAVEVVEVAIQNHNDEEYHIGEDAITDIATSAVEDHDFDSQISDAVNDAINDFDFTDVITASIKDNITFSATINVD